MDNSQETETAKLIQVTLKFQHGEDVLEHTYGVWAAKWIPMSEMRDAMLRRLETLVSEIERTGR